MGIFEELQEIERKLQSDTDSDPPVAATRQDLIETRNNLIGEVRAIADLIDGIVDLLVLKGITTDAEVRLAFQLVQRFESSDGSFEEYLASRRKYLQSLL